MSIESLPLEILVNIFRFLPFDDIISAENVSAHWKDVISDSALWRCIEIIHEYKKTNFQSFTEKILSHAQLIKYVTIRKIDQHSEISFILRTCTELEKIQLLMCRIDMDNLRQIETLSNLTVLNIKNCYFHINNKSPQNTNINFNLLSNLKVLILSDFGLSDVNFDSLLLCRNMKHLGVQKIKNISQENVIKFLVKNKDALHTLGLYAGETCNDELLKHIAECRKIEKLTFIISENFTDKGLMFLNKLNITHLTFWKNDVISERAFLEVFPKWTNLEYLSVARVKNVTEKFLHLLASKCSKLEFFGAYKCPQLQSALSEEFLNKVFPNIHLFYQA